MGIMKDMSVFVSWVTPEIGHDWLYYREKKNKLMYHKLKFKLKKQQKNLTNPKFLNIHAH